MGNAAVGTTADRIARNVAAQARAPAADLAAHRSARQLFKEAELDRDGFEQRIANGLDPCFAVYAHAQAMVSIAAEHLAMMKEARQFARIVGEAEGHLLAELSADQPGDDEPLRHVVVVRYSVRAEPGDYRHVFPAHS
jgi:hypothetical protein